MKRVLFILVPLLLMGYLIGITLIPRTKIQKPGAGNDTSNIHETENMVQNPVTTNQTLPENHMKGPLNCKSCHSCEYPTKGDPCLLDCPRESMVPQTHTSKEGPDAVVINEMSENYTGVVFSHRMHAEMSEISMGCTGCHHYNTSGPVQNCRKCHESLRQREDVSIPDLKAAYHRQCMACHKQWSGEDGCNNQCHALKSAGNKDNSKDLIGKFTGKSHPPDPKPSKMTWETNYDKGKIVTFFHDEHVQLFKLKCADCHSNDNCSKCHNGKTVTDFSKTVKIKKSIEEHHKPCSTCHSKDACDKCHQEKEMAPFNHGVSTGWNLKSFHSKLECSRCHGNEVPFKKLDNNCTSCHKNFKLGSFEHKVTGITLTDAHKEIECNVCHKDGNFSKTPVCTECHDDKSYPANSPGVKKQNK